jgi:hypothetical protein
VTTTEPAAADPTTTWTYLRSRIAVLSRPRMPDDPQLAALRAELAESRRAITDARGDAAAHKLAVHIARVVAPAPPLTDEQRARLTLLLNDDTASAYRTTDREPADA